MGETAGFDPGDWKGHDFGTSAQKTYDKHGSRSYASAKQQNKTVLDLLPKKIVCNAETGLIFLVDQTGSMGERTKFIFGKAPYLDVESASYLGDTKQISIGAIGDARNNEKYPLQVRPFTKGPDLRDKINDLVLEGDGGGQGKETYELALLYCLYNVSFPHATRKPILILTGDEGFYDTIEPSIAKKYAHVSLEGTVKTKDVYEELSETFSVYMVRCEYSSGIGEAQIHKQWQGLLGPDRVIMLEEPERIVDVIFGILAKETDKVGYFMEEITRRQNSTQVTQVLRTLKPLLGTDDAPRLLQSGITQHHIQDGGVRTKRLLGDGK